MSAAGFAAPALSRQISSSAPLPKRPRALDLAFDVDTGNAPANHMLLIMARLGNGSLRCYASEQTLADRCGFSVSSASRAIDHLKARSYIKQIICKPRTRRTCTYELCIDLWITPDRRQQNGTRHRSGCAFRTGQVDRQNQGRESGSKREASSSSENLSIGIHIAPLIANAKAYDPARHVAPAAHWSELTRPRVVVRTRCLVC